MSATPRSAAAAAVEDEPKRPKIARVRAWVACDDAKTLMPMPTTMRKVDDAAGAADDVDHLRRPHQPGKRSTDGPTKQSIGLATGAAGPA